MGKSLPGRIPVIILFACASLSAQSAAPPARAGSASAATPPNAFIVPAGEELRLELSNSLNSRTARKGDRAYFSMTSDVLVGDQVAIPRGATVRATVTSARRAGTFKKPEIKLEFNEIVLPDGSPRPISADVTNSSEPRPRGEHSSAGQVARSAGKDAAAGAILGTILGGGRGAAEGGIAGAAIGAVGVLMKHGPDLDYPRGMPFEVELTKPLNVPVAAVTIPRVAGSSSGQEAGPGIGHSNDPTDDGAPILHRRDSPLDSNQAAPVSHQPGPVFTQTATAGGAAKDPATIAANRTTPPTSRDPAPRINTPSDESSSNRTAAGIFKVKANVELVNVEATVRNRSGGIVDDLKREDFHLFEDGVEQQITNFSRDELPLAVALVVDRSGSMEPVLAELRRAAFDTLSQLKPDDEVALFSFASTVERLEDLTTDRQRIADAMGSISVGGATNITDALYQAAVYLGRAAPHRRHAIVLVSDNDGTVAGYSGDRDVIRMALETETSIFSIKVKAESFSRMMTLPMPNIGTGSVSKIARQTGGELIDAHDPSLVPSAMATVITRLKQRYSLGYTSTNPRHDGAFRQIEIRVKDTQPKTKSNYLVYARQGYYARTERAALRTP